MSNRRCHNSWRTDEVVRFCEIVGTACITTDIAAAMSGLIFAIRCRRPILPWFSVCFLVSAWCSPRWKRPLDTGEALDGEAFLGPFPTWFTSPIQGTKPSIDGSLIRFGAKLVPNQRRRGCPRSVCFVVAEGSITVYPY